MNNQNETSFRYFQKVLKPWKNVFYFLLTLVISLVLTHLLRSPGFSDSQDYVMFLLFFSVGLWLTEAIPPFAVALFIMAFLFSLAVEAAIFLRYYPHGY